MFKQSTKIYINKDKKHNFKIKQGKKENNYIIYHRGKPNIVIVESVVGLKYYFYNNN